MKPERRISISVLAVVACLGLGLASFLIIRSHHARGTAPKLRYVAQGYGGFIAAPPSGVKHSAPVAKKASATKALFTAYNAGQYSQVKREATATIRSVTPQSSVA